MATWLPRWDLSYLHNSISTFLLGWLTHEKAELYIGLQLVSIAFQLLHNARLLLAPIYLLFIIVYLLFIILYLLFIIHYLLLPTIYWLFAIDSFLFTLAYLLAIISSIASPFSLFSSIMSREVTICRFSLTYPKVRCWLKLRLEGLKLRLEWRSESAFCLKLRNYLLEQSYPNSCYSSRLFLTFIIS